MLLLETGISKQTTVDGCEILHHLGWLKLSKPQQNNGMFTTYHLVQGPLSARHPWPAQTAALPGAQHAPATPGSSPVEFTGEAIYWSYHCGHKWDKNGI